MNAFVEYFKTMEESLLSRSKVAATAGHALHKGGPRETFIRDFLRTHVSDRLSIGTGEIISPIDKAGVVRNQHDIVLYNKDYPKLQLEGDPCMFLIESVRAIIEVKSTLVEPDIGKTFGASIRVKMLPRPDNSLIQVSAPPNEILSIMVAYKGPENMSTVANWLQKVQDGLDGIKAIPPMANDQNFRKLVAPIDAVFVLGKGFVIRQDAILHLRHHALRLLKDGSKWVYTDMKSGSLVVLFALLTASVSGLRVEGIDLAPYLQGI